TLTAARKQADVGFNPKEHDNAKNKYATTVDSASIISFMNELARKSGSATPVRFRPQKTAGGQVKRYVSKRANKNEWVIYADNCCGQNKNNTVIKYLLLLTHTHQLKKASLNVFVKGYIKNNCDRGFGNLKRKYARSDIWSLSETLLPVISRPFADALQRYEGLTKFHNFEMSTDQPGVVTCRKRPSDPGKQHDLRRPSMPVDLTDGHVEDIWDFEL
ncbi:TPA: hypothetical protein N0F65_007887, partial [Lagenidium giganteum]